MPSTALLLTLCRQPVNTGLITTGPVPDPNAPTYTITAGTAYTGTEEEEPSGGNSSYPFILSVVSMIVLSTLW